MARSMMSWMSSVTTSDVFSSEFFREIAASFTNSLGSQVGKRVALLVIILELNTCFLGDKLGGFGGLVGLGSTADLCLRELGKTFGFGFDCCW